MKRKHGALIFDPSRVNSVPSVPFAHSKTGQYLQGQDLATEVKHLGSKGWGLITKQPVKQGSLVLEYVGDLISKAEARQRIEEYEKDEIDSLYLLHLRHAVDANCQSQKWVVADNQLRAFMMALRDIAAGEELTFDSYRQCSLGAHVRCMCGPVVCHSNKGTPVLQSQSETELMADAVLKCIQDTNFGSLHDLQANQQSTSRPHTSTPPHSKQLSPCTVSPLAFASPPQATREDINALGLDSPDSFLDHLHRSSARPPSSLQAITSRCRSIISQLADPAASTAQQQAAYAYNGNLHRDKPSSRARHDDSGAVLASSGDALRLASCRLSAEAAQQQAALGRLSRFAEAAPAPAEAYPGSPARQVVQQLQSFLAPYKHVLVGGYDVASQTGQLQEPAPPYKPMKALKSVLGPRLQAGNVTSLDVGWLLQEAGWPPQVQPPPGHKSSPNLVVPPASSPGAGTAFPMQPLAAFTSRPLQSPVALPGVPLLGVHHLATLPLSAAARANCALTGESASPSLTCASLAQQQQQHQQQQQQQSEGHRAFPLVDVATGSQAPPNSPEQLQSCLASLGLSSAQIQACLENAQRIEGCL